MTLPPSLLLLQALYLSKVEKSIPNNFSVSLTFSGVAFTLGNLLIVEEQGSIAPVSFSCQNMEEVLEWFQRCLYLQYR